MSCGVDDQKVATYRFINGLVELPHRYGQRWTPSEDHQAVRDYKDGIPIEYIAERLGRSVYATRLRVYRRIGKWKICDIRSASL